MRTPQLEMAGPAGLRWRRLAPCQGAGLDARGTTACVLGGLGAVALAAVLVVHGAPHPLHSLRLGAWMVFAALALFGAGAGGAYALLARWAIATYEVWVAAPSRMLLGQGAPCAVRLVARRQLTAGVELAAECTEREIHGAGKSRHEHKGFALQQILAREGPRAVVPGEQVELSAQLDVPPGGPHSLEARYARVQWALRADVHVAGLCPGLRVRWPVAVAPCVASGSGPGVPGDPDVAACWAEGWQHLRAPEGPPGLTLSLQPTDGASMAGIPVVPAGRERNLAIELCPRETLDCRGVLVSVRCRLHGEGNEEKREIIREQTIHAGALPGGRSTRHVLSIRVPPDGPVSYAGKVVRVTWEVVVRIDIPVWRDKRVALPFLVAPGIG